MSVLSAREGYRLWAPRYDAETAVSYLENRVVDTLAIPTADCRLLDVGCGTGRRLRDTARPRPQPNDGPHRVSRRRGDTGATNPRIPVVSADNNRTLGVCRTDAAIAVGVDCSLDMLRLAPREQRLAAADVRALPFAAASFDVVWCRLVIGHVRELEIAYAELSRVCRTGGAVIVSDLSGEAIAAGHRRTFRDSHGEAHELEHVVHAPERQARIARDAGLELETQRVGIVDSDIRAFYAEAGRLLAYDEQRGLPLVRAFVLRKRGE